MQELRPRVFADGILYVDYDDEFPEDHVNALRSPANLEIINKALNRVSPVPKSRLLIKQWREDVSSERSRHRLVASDEVRQRVEQNPFVQQVLDLFDGEIIDARG